MKTVTLTLGLALIALAFLPGCGKEEAADTTAAPAATTGAPAAITTANALGTVKVGDKAICVICHTNEGTTEKEEVKATLDYQGKTYAFCSEDEKARFISEPGKYTAK